MALADLARGFQILNPQNALPGSLRRGIAVVGNFDGVHRGHQRVLLEAVASAKGRRPVIALSFEPHPRTVFKPSLPVFRLSPPVEKARLFSACGLDGVLNLPFSKEFARLRAQDFVDQVLIAQMGASEVVAGYDFHFGHDRLGTPRFLQEAGHKVGFAVKIVEPVVMADGFAVSSSRIRAHLMAGELEQANNHLGYRWFVMGSVIHGQKRGRQLGYPTANMQLHAGCRLAHGVYAVGVRLQDGRLCQGVASYGRRPQFDNGAALLETMLFDFSGDLYGQALHIIFHAFLRKEARFEDIQALIAQMDLDSKKAREILKCSKPLTELDARLSF